MKYYAHIYWHVPQERPWALNIRSTMRKLGGVIYKPFDEPVGLHPCCMTKIGYDSDTKTIIENALESQHFNLSILIRESINDDLRDYTENVRWIGTPINLNLTWFNANQTDTY